MAIATDVRGAYGVASAVTEENNFLLMREGDAALKLVNVRFRRLSRC
ncbi:MAG TPA: hypothetical protein VIE89_16725 [Candidatus Binatia bacterium]